MKKLIVILMMVLSMVVFSKDIIVSYGVDKYDNDANPVVLVVKNTNTLKFTLLRNAVSPFGPTGDLKPGDEILKSYFDLDIYGYDPKHPNRRLKSLVYLKHKGRTYKEISYETLLKVLNEIGYYEWKD